MTRNGNEKSGEETATFSPVPGEPLTGKAATQERILVAAIELFLTRGYENTTIAHVAEHAERHRELGRREPRPGHRERRAGADRKSQ